MGVIKLILDDEGEFTFAFRIAGVSLVVHFLPETLMPLSETLQRYQIDLENVSDHPTVVQFVQDAPDLSAYKKWLGSKNPRMLGTRLEDGWLFSCQVGQFLASPDFTRIELWAPFERSIADTYNGNPLLMLIVWGRFSLMGGCYMHGAIVTMQEEYILLLGDSGAGKTTLSNLAVEQGFTCLTDEAPWLVMERGEIIVHSSPWPGVKGPLQALSGVLSAIFFLRHAPSNKLIALDPGDAGRRLLGNSRMFNWLPETIPGAVDLLDKTLKAVPVYELGFVPEASAVEAIRRVL